MDVGQAPVESAPPPRTGRFGGAVGRVPLPLGAKLILGFALVGALLTVGYVLGIVALGQSNSRGTELRRLQERAVYEQLLLTDATQLKKAIDYRIASPVSTHSFGSGLDQAISNDMNQLCVDANGAGCIGPSRPASPLPLTLGTVDVPLLGMLSSHVPLFYPISGTPQPVVSVTSVLNQADRFAGSFASRLAALARTTRARTNALVAANRSSFTSSRDLLIGVGAGSLVLALALALLLSWSIVAPLRRTEERLDEIATGDFTGRLEVANRDEIGALARRVNAMSDELQRV
jgi:methyl-accepting chemotaxis protein